MKRVVKRMNKDVRTIVLDSGLLPVPCENKAPKAVRETVFKLATVDGKRIALCHYLNLVEFRREY